LAIIEAIRAGLESGPGSAEVLVEPDRAQAIRSAVERAAPGDLVLLAGKGHETTQTASSHSWPFDDRTEARRALEDRFGGGPA
jgi:UDP-N-acetylmuramoyl-L-alanyl-D-glutamate--2,6-diaminopimelate ligase